MNTSCKTLGDRFVDRKGLRSVRVKDRFGGSEPRFKGSDRDYRVARAEWERKQERRALRSELRSIKDGDVA